jgi:hypothetical protein
VEGERGQEWLLWCLGSSLFANVVASFGINYMVQLQMCLYPLLACVSVAVFDARRAAVRSAEARSKVTLASFPGAEGLDLPLDETRAGAWHGVFEA